MPVVWDMIDTGKDFKDMTMSEQFEHIYHVRKHDRQVTAAMEKAKKKAANAQKLMKDSVGIIDEVNENFEEEKRRINREMNKIYNENKLKFNDAYHNYDFNIFQITDQ